jgi:glucokinase
MNQNIAIGTDIGGSHITCAAIDLTNGKILRETLTEKAVNNQAPADEIISTWAEALQNSLKKIPAETVKGIGFASPGPMDYVKGISYIKGVAKYEHLYGINISDAITSKLNLSGNLEIRFINDASSFAVGEAWAGKASKFNRSLSITLGTGFGSAFISNRIPIVDGPDVPKLGCVYHLPYKGRIADDSFSTRWFLRSYKEATGKEANGVKDLSAIAVSDRSVLSLFTEFGENMGIFLAPWLKRFNAEILVIGGNISYAYNLFGPPFEASLKKEKCSCQVALSELKEDAALLGSAYLFNDYFWKSVQHALPLM